MVIKPGRPVVLPPRDQYRIRISNDLGVDSLWNPDDDKFKVLCRMVHVTKAALHIGYVQMIISFVFSLFFGYHYVMAVTGNVSQEHWINQYTAKYVSQLFFAVAVQLILVVVMIHGVRSERRALLLPYIVFAAIAIIAGFAQLASDFVNVERNVGHYRTTEQPTSQFVSHLIATLIHAWCLSVVWRCYGFLGEKKIARQISEQLTATHAAFHYPEQFYGFATMPQPPPYADTVTTPNSENQRSIIKMDEDKQPLTLA
ncbi:hypothetical protein FO519_005994 [Halicephalobus sp. NKZ332]|nr:hypothetical protein FO519_005994 [Halicephalobus sp. NKZ332]